MISKIWYSNVNDIFLIEQTQIHDSKEVTCTPKDGNWSDWIESDDSTCTFNETTSSWTKTATRLCNNPEPLYGGTCIKGCKAKSIVMNKK